MSRNLSPIIERISQVRQAVGLSKWNFAINMDIDPVQFNKIERGYLEPTESDLLKICKQYGIRKEWLINGTGEMTISVKENIENKFKKHMDYFITACSDEMFPDYKKNIEYMQKDEEYSKIRDEIESFLPEDSRELLDDLYGVSIEQVVLESRMLFMRGLQFGVQFAKFLNITDVSDINLLDIKKLNM